MKNNGLKNEKAITLIAMVVTIIVLLILAGVSIAVLTGENGILNRATSAKQTNEQKTAEEELKLGVSALSIDYRKNATHSQTFREFVTSNSGANLKTAMGLEITNTDLIIENASAGVVSYKGQKYQVDDFGGIAEYVPMWVQNKTQVSKDGVTLEVGQAVTGYSVTANVGDTEKTIGDGNWFVLGAEDGKLLITTKTNQENIQLYGKDGYAEGVATLNSAAEKYTNSQVADGNARSINVDDINRVTGYDPDVAQYSEGNERIEQWDNEVTYTLEDNKIYYKGTKYPIYATNELGSQSSYGDFEYHNGKVWLKLGRTGIGGVEYPISTSLKYTYYRYSPLTLTQNYDIYGAGSDEVSDSYALLFSNTGWPWSGGPLYFLASTYIDCQGGYARYGIRMVCGEAVTGTSLCDSCASWNSESSANWGLRPVVILKSDVSVSSEGEIL